MLFAKNYDSSDPFFSAYCIPFYWKYRGSRITCNSANSIFLFLRLRAQCIFIQSLKFYVTLTLESLPAIFSVNFVYLSILRQRIAIWQLDDTKRRNVGNNLHEFAPYYYANDHTWIFFSLRNIHNNEVGTIIHLRLPQIFQYFIYSNFVCLEFSTVQFFFFFFLFFWMRLTTIKSLLSITSIFALLICIRNSKTIPV